MSVTQTLQYGFEILQEFRKFDPGMPMQTSAVFMLVATNPGISMSEIGEALNMSQASVSRNVAALSAVRKGNEPGHDLVRAEEDPEERRRKLVRLTEKGMSMAVKIMSLVRKVQAT